MAKASNKERSMALYESILELKSVEECCRFFDNLCTVGELRAMEQRYDVAILLDEGLVYTEILDKTGASSATKRSPPWWGTGWSSPPWGTAAAP